MSKKITVSIIGATGYTGLELIRLLVQHPNVSLKHLTSTQNEGVNLSTLWPHLEKVCDLPLTTTDLSIVAEESDVVFLALPNGESQKAMSELIGKTKIVDLSGDFRLKNLNEHEQYYGQTHANPSLVESFVYGLTEGSKESIAQASHVANPGCFAITAELALFPLKAMITHVHILGVTGSSGAGKIPKETTHHPVRNNNVFSYKIGTHAHVPEIAQTLGMKPSHITFVPTAGPFTRGIHMTAFVGLKSHHTLEHVKQQFATAYADAPFVRLKKEVQLAEVIGSNFCDIAVHDVDGQIVIQAVIDNLVKGAAGNAIHVMNLMMDLEETAGLKTLSPLFP